MGELRLLLNVEGSGGAAASEAAVPADATPVPSSALAGGEAAEGEEVSVLAQDAPGELGIRSRRRALQLPKLCRPVMGINICPCNYREGLGLSLSRALQLPKL